MKRFIPIILISLLVVSFTGCGSKSSFEAGTYRGGAPGIYGKDVVVDVTVDKNSIKEISIIENHETPGLSDAAFERIPAAIIKAQSLDVDTVGGATISSGAIIGAVAAAVEQAGDISALSSGNAEADAVSAATEIISADVVIIGAGGAGLAAAVSASQNGASVIVLEKMPQIGGNTMISGSGYNAVDPDRHIPQGIEDSLDLHYEQTLTGGDNLGEPEVVRALVDNAYPGIQWLESLGMEFEDKLFTVLGGLWPRAHKPVKPLGIGYFDAYMEYIDGNDSVTVLTDTRATDIHLYDEGPQVVAAQGLNGPVTAQAEKAVIIASGGFGNNVEMRDRFNSQWPSLTNLKSTNHPGATGDGIAMAEKIGAALYNMESIQLLPLGDPQSGSLSGSLALNARNRIFVNLEGNRFVDEGERRDVMTEALLEQEDNFMWMIVDGNSFPSTDSKTNFNETPAQLVEQGKAVMADTLEELAEKMGVDAGNLTAAVKNFNAAVDGAADPFGRTLFDKRLDTPPFYAGGRVPTVHHTMGGIRINSQAQVLDTKGNPVPRIYAAGETTGSVHGSNRLGGNALADINVFGRIAGENAAAE